MLRFGTSWNETKSAPDCNGDVWVEYWYTDITLFGWHGAEHWACCIAKYDGVPFFMFLFGFLMFRFGKAGHWEITT
jgi:hypothetical protein